MPQSGFTPQGDTAVGGNEFAAPKEKKRKKTPAPTPSYQTADAVAREAEQERVDLAQQHRQEVIDRRAGRAERQITRQAGQYLRTETLYNAPERHQVLESINQRVGLIDPRLLAHVPELAAELVMSTTKSADLSGTSRAAYEGWRAQQEDLHNAQVAGQARGYHNVVEGFRKDDPQGYADSQAIAADPVLAELTEQVYNISWLAPEKKEFLLNEIVAVARLSGLSSQGGRVRDIQLDKVKQHIKDARAGTLDMTDSPFSTLLDIGGAALNLIPGGISKGVDILGAGLEHLPGGQGAAGVLDVAQEAVGDVAGAAGTAGTFLARNLEGAAAGIATLGQHGYHAIAGGEPEGGYLTADELWTTWGEVEEGERGPFAAILARSLGTDVDDPRYQNWFTFTDMSADLIGQTAMFKGLSAFKETIRTTVAGGGSITGETMVRSYALGGPRLVSAMWDSVKDLPVSQRPARLVNTFKHMTPTMARDLANATSRDQMGRTLARHLDDVPDVEIPLAQERLAAVTEELRTTKPGAAFDALTAEKVSLEQRILDLGNREPVFEFPRISHVRPFMRGVEANSLTGRMARTFFGFARETGAVDISRISNEVAADSARLLDPSSISKPQGWASYNFDILRKTMDVIKVDKTVQDFVLNAMFEVERGNLSFYNWRLMVEDAYRSGKRYTPDMEEGIRLSTKSVDERLHSYVEESSGNVSDLTATVADKDGNPQPVRVSQLLDDEVNLPSMKYLEDAARWTTRLDRWAKTQPGVIGKPIGALRTGLGWTNFFLFTAPRVILRPLLLALNPKMFSKIEVDQSLRGFATEGVTPLDWWSVRGRFHRWRNGTQADLVEGGIPVEAPTLKNRLPKTEDPTTGAELPDYTATGLVGHEFLPEATTVRSRMPTNFDPSINTKDAATVGEAIANHIVELASDPLTQRIATYGADATIKFLKENPNHPVAAEWRARVLPKLEKIAADKAVSQGTRYWHRTDEVNVPGIQERGILPTVKGERPGGATYAHDDPAHVQAWLDSGGEPGRVYVEYETTARVTGRGSAGSKAVKTEGGVAADQLTGRVYRPGDKLDLSGIDPIAEAVNQQALEIKQITNGDPELTNAIGTGHWRTSTPRQSQELRFLEDEIRTTRETLAVTETAFEREALNLRLEQLERKYAKLSRPARKRLDIRDREALADQIVEKWKAGEYKPTSKVMVDRKLAWRDSRGGRLQAAQDWAQRRNAQIYKTFKPYNAVTRDMSRGSLYRKVLDRTEQRLLELGYSPQRALSAAQYRAALITKDLMYDISARSTLDRKLQGLFWFEPVWREQLSVWLGKIPQRAFWAPGLALEYGVAHTLLQGLRDMGILYDSEPFINPDTGKEVPGRPYFKTPWGNFSVGGFNPLSPGSETILPTISPGAEFIFDNVASSPFMPEKLRPWFETFADKFTFDHNTESTPWMPRGVALVASNLIGIAEFFGADLSGLSIGQIGEYRRKSVITATRWAMADLAEEGILPPTQEEGEADEDFYARLRKYRAQVETISRRHSIGLDFLYTFNGIANPAPVEDVGKPPEQVAWETWRYEEGPFADVPPGELEDWQYTVQDAYLSAHPEQWPFAVGDDQDLDPDPDVYNPGPLDADGYTDKAIEQYHFWGDPPTVEKDEGALGPDNNPAAFAALEPRKQAKLITQWAADDLEDLTPTQADVLGLPKFEGRDDLLKQIGAIQKRYEAKYDYDMSDTMKKFLLNERDYLLKKAAAEYGELGQRVLDFQNDTLIQKLTSAGVLTSPEVDVIRSKAAAIRRDIVEEGYSLGGASKTIGSLQAKADLFRLIDQLRQSSPRFDREMRYIELGLGEKDGPLGKIQAYQYIFFGEPFYDSGLAADVAKEMH